ncbi:MAG: phosphate ABC transporter, permease protein PstA, partial [Povalibacter sp.]
MSAVTAAPHRNVDALRTGLSRRKMMDQIFVIVGLVVMLACLAILAVLFIDLVRDGSSRFSIDFFTHFASRNAQRAGILAAWVGTTLVMLVTAFCAVPVGVAAAIYLEEYAPKNWFSAVIEIN